MGKKTKHKDRFKQMCRVNKEVLTLHRHLLDQGHRQAPARRPPVKQGCSRHPAIRSHGLTAAQVSCHRNQHHHIHHHCGPLFQEDVNTSVSWDLVNTDTDTEVASINSPSHQTVTNKNCADSSNESQNNAVGLNHQLRTLGKVVPNCK